MNDSTDPLDFLNDAQQPARPTGRQPSTGLHLQALRKKSRGIPVSVIVGAVVAVVLLMAAGGAVIFTPKTESSADQDAVRTYFREHLNAAKWEEVRWWPAVTAERAKANRLATMRATHVGDRKDIDAFREALGEPLPARHDPDLDSPDRAAKQQARLTQYERGYQESEAAIDQFAREPPPRIVRLKFRTLGPLEMLHDEYFQIKDGKAEPAPAEWCSQADFPE